MLESARYYVRLYWWWMTSGSLLRFAIGYGAPIALIVLAVQTVRGDDMPPGGLAAANSRPGPTAEVAGKVSSPQATPNTSTAPARTPTVAASVLTYVVKSGDNLGAICSAHVPAMAINACVAAIVELNKLGGPDKLAVGQTLTLPATGGSSSSGNQSIAATTPGAAVNTSTPRPTSTVAGGSGTSVPTPRPSSTAVPGQQQTALVKIDSLSSPVKPGATANLNATVAPNASCAMSFAAPNGSPADSSIGQVAKSADAGGKISWTWDVSKNTKKGKGLVVVTCSGTSVSSYLEIN